MKKSGISDTSGQGRNWPAERRFQRIGCDLNARFLYQDQWRPAKIITLSGGGAFLACKRRVKNNQVIYLEFDLDDQPISAISRVVWKKNGAPPNNHFSYPPGFAVEFESMEGKERVSVNQ